jgi:hypothetical protein
MLLKNTLIIATNKTIDIFWGRHYFAISVLVENSAKTVDSLVFPFTISQLNCSMSF